MRSTLTRPHTALLGLSAWGTLLARVCCDLKIPIAGVDPDPDKRLAFSTRYPGLPVYADPADVFVQKHIRHVLIATPSSTHYGLASEALRHEKHVFVEKPMTQNSAQARRLVALARSKRRTLMVDHSFVYSDALAFAARLIKNGTLGRILSVRSVRENAGPVRADSSILWDLAPHDLSIGRMLFADSPTHLSLHGASPHKVTVSMIFGRAVPYSCTLSWIAKRKKRHLTIKGSLATLVIRWDGPRERMTLTPPVAPLPKRAPREPLRTALGHFFSSAKNRTAPRTDGNEGAEVVTVIERLSALTASGTRRQNQANHSALPTG